MVFLVQLIEKKKLSGSHHPTISFFHAFTICIAIIWSTTRLCHGFLQSHHLPIRNVHGDTLNGRTVKSHLFKGGSGNDRSSSDFKRVSVTTEPSPNDEMEPSGGIAGGLQVLQRQQDWLKNLDNNPINTILQELEYSPNALPMTFELKERGSVTTRKRVFQIRQMEIKDLQRCVALCLQEYGKYSKSTSNTFQSKLDDLDNFVFSFVVLLGLEQRVTRRMQSDASSTLPQDHNVVLLSELVLDDIEQDAISRNSDKAYGQYGNRKEVIFGMAEISLQPPDPSRTAPPFVVPTKLKTFLADLIPSSATKKNNKKKPLCAYVSNVLITNEYRSRGYSKFLMAACHGLARSWGYAKTYLHVDADYKSGRAAQQLYRKLGYKPFVDKTYNEQFAWMGIDSVNRGLYIVDGVPLLFLKKDL